MSTYVKLFFFVLAMSGMTLNVEENRLDITTLYKRLEKLELDNELKDKRIQELEKGDNR